MWVPVAPLWTQASNGDYFVAIAKSETCYRCYAVELPSIDPKVRILPHSEFASEEPLGNEIDKVAKGTQIGDSIISDLKLIVLCWLAQLSDPLYENILPSRIKFVIDLAEDPDFELKDLVLQVDQIDLLLNQRRLARDPLCGEVCGSSHKGADIARIQMEPFILNTPSAQVPHIYQDHTFSLNLSHRLQNQAWKAVVYLRSRTSRVTQSLVFTFNPDDNGVINACFTHVFASDLYLVVEVSAGEISCPYTRIACGFLPLPMGIRGKITMMTPYGGDWSQFVDKLIEGAGGDRCPLLPTIPISQDPVTPSCTTPSFVQDGFNIYNALHLETLEFVAATHQNSAYYLRFCPQGESVVDQTTSSLLYHNQTSNECFTFSNFACGQTVRVELWRGQNLVSVSNANYQKGTFNIIFKSLTTFQSVGITKQIGTLHCKATFMGQQKKQDPILRIEDYKSYSEVQALAQIRAFSVDKTLLPHFKTLGVAFLELMCHFDGPQIHEAAFIKLLALLEACGNYPYSLNILLDSSLPPSFKNRKNLTIILRQVHSLLKVEQMQARLIDQSANIGKLLLFIAGENNSEDKQPANTLSDVTNTLQPVGLNENRSLVGHKKPHTTPFDAIIETESSRNDALWREKPLVEQIQDIVVEMVQAYADGSSLFRLKLLKSLETLFDTFYDLVGAPALMLLCKFLVSVGWSTHCPEINTQKLQILAKTLKKWRLEAAIRSKFTDICLGSIAPVWTNKESNIDQRRLDLHATCCILQGLMDTCAPEYIARILGEILPLLFNAASSLVEPLKGHCKLSRSEFCQVLECGATDPSIGVISVEIMLLVEQFLKGSSTNALPSFSVLGQATVKQIVLNALTACEMWSQFGFFSNDMYSAQLIQAKATFSTLKYVAAVLTRYFLPSPDEEVAFESSLWYKLFSALSALALWSDTVAPNNPLEAHSHSELIGDLKAEAIQLIDESWRALQWNPSAPGNCNLFYGYQVGLFCCENNVTSLFVQLIFAGNQVVEPLLRNIVGTEWIINQSLHDLCLEVMEALDTMFVARYRLENSTQAVPSEEQCARFVSIFEENEDPNYRGFVESIKTFLGLLRDNYQHDSLLTVYRVVKFLKKQRATLLFTRYIGLILQSEKNPRYLGLALVELASMYQWDDKAMAEALVRPPLPAQKGHIRREALMQLAAQRFVESGSLLLAIETLQECHGYYERILDYHRLALVSCQLGELYERLAIERSVSPNYYLVVFPSGLGGLSGEAIVYEQPSYIRLDEFTEAIKAKYAQASIKTVEPVPDRSLDDEEVVMPWLYEAFRTHRTRRFQASSAKAHCGVQEMAVERVEYRVEDAFPTLCCQSRVVETGSFVLSALENAIEVVRGRTRELRAVCSRYARYPNEDKISVYLEMLLGSTLSSPINGGLTQYRDLFARDRTHELMRAFQELRQSAEEALGVYGEIHDESMRPQYEHFMCMFRENF